MSGLTIADIREALAAQIRDNIDKETNVDAFNNVGMTFPRIRISLADIPRYTASYGGLAVVPFVVTIEPAGTDESAVRRLDDYLSAGLGNVSSVFDALKAWKTGPLASVAQVVDIQPRSYDAVNVTAELDVQIQVLKLRAA